LKALLATQSDLDPVGEAGEGGEAARLAESLHPDVLLLDVTMPGNEHFAVRERAPGVLVISVKTVETHKAHIADKLGLKSRVEWLRYAREKGWLREQ
jgi:DNA-binding NarL/FixJ family response regulator